MTIKLVGQLPVCQLTAPYTGRRQGGRESVAARRGADGLRTQRRNIWKLRVKKSRQKNHKLCRNAHSEARLASVAVLLQPIRELLPLVPAVALGHQATVRDALEVMRQKQLSCVLVVEHGQLVGVFTERDVLTKVTATPLAVDRVPLQDVMQPDPECLQLDNALVYALHQMHRGAYRHVPAPPVPGARRCPNAGGRVTRGGAT